MAKDDLMDSSNRFGIKEFVKILGGTDGAQTDKESSFAWLTCTVMKRSLFGWQQIRASSE